VVGGIVESWRMQPAQSSIFLIILASMIAMSYKMLGFSWGAYMTVCLLVPILSGTLMSISRYGLTLVPMFLGFALWLEKHKLKYVGLAYIILSAMYLMWQISVSFNGYFVG
jgi:hypothetical protein